MAICDECSRNINRDDGFLFYSGAAMVTPMGTQIHGNMLLCQNCTDEIIVGEKYGGSLSPTLSGIVKVCQNHGLPPQHAKEKARSLARHWWENREKAEKESVQLWKAPPKDLAQKEEFHISAGYRPKRHERSISKEKWKTKRRQHRLRDRRKADKKWWQFWI